MTKWQARAILILGAGLVSGCSDGTTAPPPSDPAAVVLPAGAQTVTGTLAGARYALYRPDDWNGDLVLYIMGYQPGGPPALPDEDSPELVGGFRDALLEAGYAVAWSSRSETGMAISDGVTHTRQLQGLFTSKLGRPKHTYVYGSSLGGGMAMELAQGNPGKFDGVITESGIVAGLPFQIAHYFNVRVLFEYFYPDVELPGTVTTPGSGYDPALVFGAVFDDPGPAQELAAIDQVALEYNDDIFELAMSIAYPLMFQTAEWFTGELLTRTHGRPFFDNSTVVYSGSSNDEALNAGVQRFRATPDARNMVARMYTPSDRLRLPTLVMHCRRDPIVPVGHAFALAQLAAQSGTSNLLLVRIEEEMCHAEMPVALKLAAVEDLASWVRTGVKPAS